MTFSCPYCGHSEFTVKPSDETFQERVGCLSCDLWITPVMFHGETVVSAFARERRRKFVESN